LIEVKNGKPYLGAGTSVLKTVRDQLLANKGFTYVSTNSYQDALFFVEYLDESMVTASYVADEDNIMYGYGGAYISAIPEGAKILIEATNDEPLEGFFLRDNLDQFLGQIQAFEYVTDDLDLTIFANSLTSKAPQQGRYEFSVNAIFSNIPGGQI